MYLPRLFREDDRARLAALVDASPFATVVAVGGGGQGDGGIAPEIAHLPCLVDGDLRRVELHVARGNPLAELAASRARMTAVFHGPHAYVTPRWYTDPPRRVPTWSYAVVHLNGPARVLDEAALVAQLGAMAARFEAGAAAPWRVEDAAPGVVEGLLRGLVGIAIDVDRVEGKFKLGQNRAGEDRAGVMSGLAGRAAAGDAELLALMRDVGG